MFYIVINGKKVLEIDGMDIAFEAYRKACELGELVGASVELVDAKA